MTTASLNGIRLTECVVHIPRAGAWHADVHVDTTDTSKVTGSVTLLIGDSLTLKGTIRRADVWRGVVVARVTAGAGGLGKTAFPQGYASTTAKIVIGDIAALAGETVSSTSSSSLLSTTLASWMRARSVCGNALRTVVDQIGATWRHLPDGSIWIGTEVWPDSGIVKYQLLEKDPQDGHWIIDGDSPALMPGTLLTGGKVGRVMYRLAASRVRTEVWFE